MRVAVMRGGPNTPVEGRAGRNVCCCCRSLTFPLSFVLVLSFSRQTGKTKMLRWWKWRGDDEHFGRDKPDNGGKDAVQHVEGKERVGGLLCGIGREERETQNDCTRMKGGILMPATFWATKKWGKMLKLFGFFGNVALKIVFFFDIFFVLFRVLFMLLWKKTDTSCFHCWNGSHF